MLHEKPETYFLSDYPHINEPLLCELNNLLGQVSPGELRKSLQHVLFNYLLQNNDVKAYNFQQVIEHLYLLMEFLDEVEGKKH